MTARELAAARGAGHVLGLPPRDSEAFCTRLSSSNAVLAWSRSKPALRDFFVVLKEHEPWTVGVLLHTPAEFELRGLTPLEWVKQRGDREALVSRHGS